MASIPLHPNINYAIYYEPLETVSGDYYDIFQLNNNTLGILIADISGHGANAALLSLTAKIYFEKITTASKNPDEILTLINKKLSHLITTSDYLTAFYLHLSFDDFILKYSNAGHQYVILWKYENKDIEVLDTAGFFLAASYNLPFPYKTKSIQIHPKDKLILYTDGLIAQNNNFKVKYSFNRLISLIRRDGSLSCEELKNNIIHDFNHFKKSQPKEDDITLFIIEIK